uniref:APC membrane recruitment protein 2 n=1 Tax=Amphiprion percula TaxID=161767 RepID=A0A3P8U6J5_AMPPE
MDTVRSSTQHACVRLCEKEREKEREGGEGGRGGEGGEGGRGGEGGMQTEKTSRQALEQVRAGVKEHQTPPVAPQCDPQPTGKINKAAFKLFGKRRTGSGMASFFSFRNKGATNASVELVRSKTHDGLTSSNNDADGHRGDGLASLEAGPVRSLSKSLSFFSLLRRGSFRSSENGGAGLVRRGRGLKGFFSSMRWRRKEKTNEGDGEEVEGKKKKDGDTADSEKVKDITLTLEPPPHHHQEDCGHAEAGHNLQAAETPTTSVTITPPHCVAMPGPSGEPDSPFPYTPTDSPLRPPIQKAKASISSLTPSLATPPLDRCSTGDPPSEPSVDRLCSLLFTDVTSLKSFDSLTGCGDIIADADEEGPVGNGGSGTSSTGSGVVAYMGGGEEMASPEGVDDADMQGLWHMLPSTGDNSPALPRSHQPSSTTPTSTYPPRTNPASCHLPSASRSTDRKVPQVKALGLSKIPIVGGAGSRAAKPPLPHSHGRHPTSPGEKEPLSDEGYWDTPSATPTATPDESGLQRNQQMALSRDSCSGDHLYDLYNDPEEEGEDQGEDEDLNSTPSPSTEYKMSPTSQTTPPSSSSSSSFRSMKGSASLPRESKIPVSNKQQTPPPHSVSQSALSSVLEAESPQPKNQVPPPARTRIPVSKVPVRRSGNKPGSTTRGASHKK